METDSQADRQACIQAGMETGRQRGMHTDRLADSQAGRETDRKGDIQTERPGGGLMNTVINYDSGKPSDPLRGYSYAHESNFDRPAKSWSRCTK